ncbi:MAG: DUF4091 domain-containing protein [Oscillospiraceae bacterium]|nr:DUF4091 domain-containing protein [Oscillospiraceae bacterium]
MPDSLKARKGLPLALPPLLTAAFAAALAWYYDVYIDWKPALYPFAIIVAALGVAALTLLALWARGERKRAALIWKTALSVIVFLAALPGLPLVINNAMFNLLFWQQYQQNVTGLLYWDVTYWQKANPWVSAASWGSYRIAGDGTWFYPGMALGLHEPIPSLRLKNIADGMEDYDLLYMAEEAFGRAYCLEKAAQLSTALAKYMSDPEKIEQARVSILKDLAGR